MEIFLGGRFLGCSVGFVLGCISTAWLAERRAAIDAAEHPQ